MSINKWDFFGGLLFTIPAVALFLSLFSQAPWAQLKWGRKAWGPAIVPISRLSRVLLLLWCGFFAATSFAGAFHYDLKSLNGIMGAILGIIFVLIIFSNIRDTRHYKSKHPPEK